MRDTADCHSSEQTRRSPTPSKDAEGVAMKQARRWLLFAAALVLLPQAAYAHKKKPHNAAPAPAHGPMSMPMHRPAASITNAPGEHSAISIACSKKADAQGLHGDARQRFRNKCKHGG